MEVNTLVRHKKLSTLGIGCISKKLSKHVYVNWGTHDVNKHSPSVLEVVDTSMCDTISFQKLKSMTITNINVIPRVIIGNEVKEYVGIGWVSVKVVQESDLTKYPRVVD